MTIEKKINISVAVFLALIVLIGAFVIRPLFMDIQEDAQWLVSEKSRFSALNQRIDDLKKFDSNFPIKNREEIMKQIDSLFIDSEVPVDFISFLEKTGSQSSVSIDISPFSAGSGINGSWPFLNFQATISGSFPSFLLFLEKIENSPYLIEIQNLTISLPTETKQSPGNIKAFLSFKIFSK